MKTFMVKYSDAGRAFDIFERFDLKKSFLQRIYTQKYFYCLKLAAKCFEQEGTKESFYFLLSSFSKAFLGSLFSKKMFPKLVKSGENYYDTIKSRMVEYIPDTYLYHITPVENINSIKRDGLFSEDGEVYLSRDVDYFKWFAYYKANELKRDVKFCILKIDAVSLSKVQKLYYKYHNVYYTGNIDPKFIINL